MQTSPSAFGTNAAEASVGDAVVRVAPTSTKTHSTATVNGGAIM